MFKHSLSQVRRLPNERNDCSVVALSIAFNKPYEEVHKWLATKGRPPRKGLHLEKALGIADALWQPPNIPKYTHLWGKDLAFTKLPYWEYERTLISKTACYDEDNEVYWKWKWSPRINVKQWLKTHMQGTFLVFVRGHVFCVKDGVMWDWKNPQWCEIRSTIEIL